ncbi:hypothetical protein K432DRAFT_396842 [Lepidopterella palustris CBS 459.81]|uniref:Uncharacterized protein n=1 Tax=Lepidopterella palustris CBS 459.81 TaxID=1314670 RepID=A0A8E2E243_9PEZI|nr:hypothetical protein K432DRAFT_396842 [Lepidopterella palustris CBS 459.81]
MPDLRINDQNLPPMFTTFAEAEKRYKDKGPLIPRKVLKAFHRTLKPPASLVQTAAMTSPSTAPTTVRSPPADDVPDVHLVSEPFILEHPAKKRCVLVRKSSLRSPKCPTPESTAAAPAGSNQRILRGFSAASILVAAQNLTLLPSPSTEPSLPTLDESLTEDNTYIAPSFNAKCKRAFGTTQDAAPSSEYEEEDSGFVDESSSDCYKVRHAMTGVTLGKVPAQKAGYDDGDNGPKGKGRLFMYDHNFSWDGLIPDDWKKNFAISPNWEFKKGRYVDLKDGTQVDQQDKLLIQLEDRRKKYRPKCMITHPPPLDWNDEEAINYLNSYTNQERRRCLQETQRKVVGPFIPVERKFIAREVTKNPRLSWAKIERLFNKTFEGKIVHGDNRPREGRTEKSLVSEYRRHKSAYDAGQHPVLKGKPKKTEYLHNFGLRERECLAELFSASPKPTIAAVTKDFNDRFTGELVDPFEDLCADRTEAEIKAEYDRFQADYDAGNVADEVIDLEYPNTRAMTFKGLREIEAKGEVKTKDEVKAEVQAEVRPEIQREVRSVVHIEANSVVEPAVKLPDKAGNSDMEDILLHSKGRITLGRG